MRLILNEMVYHYYDRDVAESVKTIIHETTGLHHIREGILWFAKSGIKRIKIEPNNDIEPNQFARLVNQAIRSTTERRHLSCYTKYGQVYLERIGGAQDV